MENSPKPNSPLAPKTSEIAAQPSPGNPEVEARKRAVQQEKEKRLREREQRKRQREQEKKQRAQARENAKAMRQDRLAASQQRGIDRSAGAEQKRAEKSMGVATRDAIRKNKSKTTAGKQFFSNRSSSNLAVNSSTEINCIGDMVGLNEDMYFKVKIEGLPTMYVNSANREELRKDLVGLLRNPSKAVGDIKRVTSAEVKKRLRLRSQGKEEEEMNESQSDGYYMMTQAKKSAADAGEDYNDRSVADRHTEKVAKEMGYTHKDYTSDTYYKSRMPGSRLIESVEMNETYIKFDHPKLKFISKGFIGRKEAERHNDHLVGKEEASHKSFVQKHKDGKFYVVDMNESEVNEAKKTKPSFSRAYNRDKRKEQAELRRQHDQNVKSELGIKEEAQLDEDIRAMLINEGYSEEDIQYIIDEGLWDSIKSGVKSAADKIKKTTSNIRRKVMNPNKDSLLSKARTKLGLNAKPKPVVAKPKPKPATTVVSSKPAPRKPTYHNNNRKDKIAKTSNTGGVVNRSSKNKSAHVPLSTVNKPKPAAPAPVATNKPTATSNISPAALAIAKKYAKTEDVMTSTSADSQVKLNPETGKYEKKRMKRGQINAQTATESVMSKLKNHYTNESSAYYAGLSKSTADDRKAHFKKHGKKADDDNSAYKPAPGDFGKKTKKSKHTEKAAAMGMGPTDEACWSKYKQVGMKKKGEKMVPNCVPESYNINENKKGLENKAEKSGMPLGVLKQVYNRGMAAWKTGHRPGTTPEQWGMARVNSFITKSSGTWGKADKDLAAKVKK